MNFDEYNELHGHPNSTHISSPDVDSDGLCYDSTLAQMQ